MTIPAVSDSTNSPLNGVVAGKGGNANETILECGVVNSTHYLWSAGGPGGDAIKLNCNLTINNAGIIGGGGGGAIISAMNTTYVKYAGGGGAGIDKGSSVLPATESTYLSGTQSFINDAFQGNRYTTGGGNLGQKGNGDIVNIYQSNAPCVVGYNNAGKAINLNGYCAQINNIGSGRVHGEGAEIATPPGTLTYLITDDNIDILTDDFCNYYIIT